MAHSVRIFFRNSRLANICTLAFRTCLSSEINDTKPMLAQNDYRHRVNLNADRVGWGGFQFISPYWMAMYKIGGASSYRVIKET